MVMMLHGGPHANVNPILTCLRYSLLRMGYVIVLPDFPGSIGYGSDYLKQAIGQIGKEDVKLLL